MDGPFDVADRVAVVTGASSGLGERFARVLHRAGARVVLAARRGDRLRALTDELGADRAAYHAGDLTSDAHVAAVIDLALSRFGRLDIVVANAGDAYEAPIDEEPMARLRRLIELNLTSVIALCRAAGPALRRAPAGSVILVSSMFGLVGVDPEGGPMAGYTATKGALVNLARELARQWGPDAVRVNALAPGFFPTELTGFLASESHRGRIRRNTLLRRPGEIDELDGPLLFLASDASSYMTGQTLVIDGGWTAV